MSLSGLLSALSGLIGLARDLLAWRRSAADRQAGRAAVRAEALARQADELRVAQAAANDAARRHDADPTDAAFNSRYRRDD